MKWVDEARKYIGQKEIRGSKHNPWILDIWKRIGWGGVYKTDELAWCGGFIAYVMMACGIKVPGTSPRALEWAAWGVECEAQYGAVGVMTRKGGGHVCLLVGADETHYMCLGGNQDNEVSIRKYPKERIKFIRWPKEVPQARIKLQNISAISGVSEA